MMLDIIQWLIDAIAYILSGVISLLPDSPFLWNVPSWLEPVAYFIPFGSMLTVFGYYTAAVLVWYGIRLIFRLVRAIQ